ncbi:ATP-dependent DNA ligase [Lactifluus volemus]|nr:ATP-dependent DNA ligase [Lactifluus volemus]
MRPVYSLQIFTSNRMGTPLGTLYGPSCNFDNLLSILASLCQTPAHPPAATAAVSIPNECGDFKCIIVVQGREFLGVSKVSKSTTKANGKRKGSRHCRGRRHRYGGRGQERCGGGTGEDAEERKAVSKSVEAALDWRDKIDVKGWKIGDLVPYAALAKAFALIEVTTKQLEKTSLLTGLMLLIIQRHKAADTRADSLLRMLCPDYTGIELRIGESLLIKAIGKSTGRNLKEEGDLGLVGMASEPPTVTHSEILTFLEELQKWAPGSGGGHAVIGKTITTMTTTTTTLTSPLPPPCGESHDISVPHPPPSCTNSRKSTRMPSRA